MNFSDVAEELAARLGVIATPGDPLRVYPQPEEGITPPALVIGYPEAINFDQTYQRGMDRYRADLILLGGKPYDRSTRKRMGELAAGSGPRSIKAYLEGFQGWTTFDALTVPMVEFDGITLGGVFYMAAVFTLDIVGNGEVET